MSLVFCLPGDDPVPDRSISSVYWPADTENLRPLVGCCISGTSPVRGQSSPSMRHPLSSRSPIFLEYRSARFDMSPRVAIELFTASRCCVHPSGIVQQAVALPQRRSRRLLADCSSRHAGGG